MLKEQLKVIKAASRFISDNLSPYTFTISILLILLIYISTITSCEENGYYAEIPNVYVNETVNLNLFEYQNLQFIGGYAYLDAGVRGIILYRKSTNDYIAFERNCTYRPLDSCATVEVDSSLLFMVDHCCGSTFDFEGNPTSGPAEWPLKRYYTFLDGTYLKIANSDF